MSYFGCWCVGAAFANYATELVQILISNVGLQIAASWWVLAIFLVSNWLLSYGLTIGCAGQLDQLILVSNFGLQIAASWWFTNWHLHSLLAQLAPGGWKSESGLWLLVGGFKFGPPLLPAFLSYVVFPFAGCGLLFLAAPWVVLSALLV
ncbi:hypothetical protein U1Q18_020492 [Sarracenia purpurea var. burkii]